MTTTRTGRSVCFVCECEMGLFRKQSLNVIDKGLQAKKFVFGLSMSMSNYNPLKETSAHFQVHIFI